MSSLTKYLIQMRLSVLDILEYRLDFLLHVIKYASAVLLMSLVWIAVGRENPAAGLNPATTAQYFAWGAILYGFSNFHTYYIEDDIKMGHLSRFLLKPIRAFWYYIVHELGQLLTESLIKLVVLLPVLIYFGWQWPSLQQGGLILIFLPTTFFVAFNIYSIISTLTFWLTETWALRWSVMITIRFLSGILVPLFLLPPLVQQAMWWLPFPHLASTPILLIQNRLSLTQAFQGWLILVVWGVILYAFREWLWNRGVRHYDNIGI